MKTQPSFSRSAIVIFILLTLAIVTVSGFDVDDFPIHQLITEIALNSKAFTVNGRPRKFSHRAIEEAMKANEKVDSIPLWSAALMRPNRHFTNESFVESSGRLVRLKGEIKESLTL